MDALTYFIIAAVLFIVAMTVEVLLAKQDAVKNMSVYYDTADVTIAIMVTLFMAAGWLITIPVGILALTIYGISRWLTNWLNK